MPEFPGGSCKLVFGPSVTRAGKLPYHRQFLEWTCRYGMIGVCG
jgi:hypothetical protein